MLVAARIKDMNRELMQKILTPLTLSPLWTLSFVAFWTDSYFLNIKTDCGHFATRFLKNISTTMTGGSRVRGSRLTTVLKIIKRFKFGNNVEQRPELSCYPSSQSDRSRQFCYFIPQSKVSVNKMENIKLSSLIKYKLPPPVEYGNLCWLAFSNQPFNKNVFVWVD